VVTATRELDEVLNNLVIQAQHVLGSAAVGLFLRVDGDPRRLRVKAAHGLPTDLLQPDALQQEVDERAAGLFGSVASIPVDGRDETYGSLVLYYNTPPAHSAELSLAFAQQAALAIENARLRAEAEQRLAEIERRRRVAEGLRDLLAVVNSSHDLDEILVEVLAQSSRLLGNDASIVYLRDTEEGDILRARAWLGLDPEALARAIRIGSPTTGLAVKQGRTLVCEDLVAAARDELTHAADTRLEEGDGFARVVRLAMQTDPDLEPDQTRGPRLHRLIDSVRAVASTPLIARGRSFGALALYYAQPRTFSTEEVGLARAFAEQATQAIETARLHAEVERRMHENDRRRRVAEGMRDLLAGVNSTRSLDEVLDLVLEQAAGVLGCDAGSILLLDERDGKQAVLTTRASRALVAELLPAQLPVGTAVTGVAVERRRPVVVTDLQQAASVSGEDEPVIQPGPGYIKMLRIGNLPDGSRIREIARYYRSMLAVPLGVRGRVQGSITLFYQRPREFSREDLGLAQAFADQTALAVENARLHVQTVRRSRDLEALYKADEMLYRSLDLQQVLEALVDVASEVLEADMCSVLVWDERHERLVPGATRGFRPESVAQMSHARGEGITTRVALSGEPIAVEDAVHDPRVAHRITDAEGIRSLLHVPIKVHGEVFGVFGVNYRQPRELSGGEERVLLALAHRAAVAIENAQLYTESERRRHDLEALYRADETLYSSLRPDDVLRSLVDVATSVMDADKISVTIWDPQQQQLVTAAAHGYSPESTVDPLMTGQDLATEDVLGHDIILITDAATDPRLASPRLRELIQRECIRTAVATPIVVAGQPYGIFSVAFCTEHVASADEQRLVHALGQRAGLALQNARLFEHAQEVATAEERQRLARELHDAVTQTLFSASLIAEVLPRLWARSPDQARERLEELRRLTRGALAEMRTLLLELRPAALVETPFGQLLKQLKDAFSSRATVHIDVRVETDERLLPPEVQIGLYRIAQEALNNTVKHADAEQAEVLFRYRDSSVELTIRDDGRGFDVSSTPPGHLGLSIMRERARAINAHLRVDSRIGSGTRLTVRWPSDA
jgi:GAF domain-containing protein